MKNYEDLYNHIRANVKTADYCEFDVEVEDWCFNKKIPCGADGFSLLFSLALLFLFIR